MNKKGTSIAFAIFALIILSIVSVVVFSIISSETFSSANFVLAIRAFYGAESGWQIGAQAVKNDKNATQTTTPSNEGYCGVVYLDGYQATGAEGKKYDRALFYKRNPMKGQDADRDCELKKKGGAGTRYLIIYDFQQRTNLLGGAIKSARMAMRAKNGGGGSFPQIALQYSTDGGLNWNTLGGDETINNTSFQTVYRDFPSGSTWQALVDGTSFRIRALRTNANAGKTNIDWLGLEVTVECDTLLEPWSSNSFITLPADLGNAEIDSILTVDEASKIHLNYASQLLLQRLMEEVSVTNASSKSQAVVNYRTGTGWFNTIEEINEVSALDDGDFDLLKDYITVYSWVNQNVTRATGERAPVNVNTASETVLKAIFKTIDSSILSTSQADDLASEIVLDRQAISFTNMNSSFAFYDDDLSCFAYYVEDQKNSSLSGAGSDARANAVREVADGSLYNLDEASSWTGGNQTGTEFCYYAHTFLITSTGKSGNIERKVSETYGNTYNYTTYVVNQPAVRALPVYVGEANPKPYWREVVE